MSCVCRPEHLPVAHAWFACTLGWEICAEGDGDNRNSCRYANDGECDDGGPEADSSICTYGSDCSDCGLRNLSTGTHEVGNQTEDEVSVEAITTATEEIEETEEAEETEETEDDPAVRTTRSGPADRIRNRRDLRERQDPTDEATENQREVGTPIRRR